MGLRQNKSGFCYPNPEMEVQTLKGFRDIEPTDALKRGRVLSLVKSIFKSYGFVPLETPTLEYASVLEGKYGEEGEKLIYKFQDRGGRAAALRYDLTVPLARYVAQNQGKLTFPFKRYQIGSVFRADKPQAGRYREFTQVDIDSVGVDSALADAEIMAVLASVLQILGVKDFVVEVNDRTLFANLPPKAVHILDKWDKIGKEKVKGELTQAGMDGAEIVKIFEKQTPTPRIEEAFKLVESFGIDKKVIKFNPLLARGLDYYTGLIFEVKVKGASGSLAGGGRYDKMLGIFTGQDIPAVGVSFGLDRLMEFVPEETVKDVPFTPQVLITVFSAELATKSIEIFNQVQGAGVDSEIYLDPQAKLEKQLKYADRKGIPFAVIAGPKELEKGVVLVKDLKKGTQDEIAAERLPHLFVSQPQG
ncbi:MAG: histidine--tRNA ligase [Patescibacteria group bacterium]